MESRSKLGVGMSWIHQHLLHRPHFNNISAEHDGDPVADIVGGCQVVGDVEHADTKLIPELLEQIDDRHAQRGIHHRDGLIGDQEHGVGHQRPGDRNALELPAGKFIGVLPGELRIGKAHRLSFSSIHSMASWLTAGQFVVAHGFKEITVHRAERVEGAERILENRLNAFGDPYLFLFGLDLAVMGDRARGGFFKTQDDFGSRGFPAAAFAGQGEDLSRFDVKADHDRRP